MGLPQGKSTLAEYLPWENTQPERHEIFRGEIFDGVEPLARTDSPA